MMQVAFLLALIVTIVGIIYVFKFKENTKIKMIIIIVSSIISLTILVFPLYQNTNTWLRLINSFFYALQSVGINQDFSVISDIDLQSLFGVAYVVYMYLIFLDLPILTVSVVVIIISDMFVNIKFVMNKNKSLCIFSDINEKSIMVAKKILNNKNNMKIVFANCGIEDNKFDYENVKGIKLKQNILDLKIGSKNNVIFYLISDNEEENLNNSLALIEKYHDRKNTKVYVVNNTEVASVILDSTDKGDVNVEIINETERAIYNLLDRYPLYLNSLNNKISILIIGCGRVGKEFLKMALWCGQIIGYELQITVVDKVANEIKEDINIETPELLSYYDVTFINSNINAKLAQEAIKNMTDINYILVSMENDEKNINTAIMLRRLFIQQDKESFTRSPIINVWIDNQHKKEQINKLVNEKKVSYNINAFGSIKDMYFDNCIINSEIEELAKQVHLSYDNTDIEFKRYNLLEYNKRSSRATALHLKYKLYSILKENYKSNLSEDLKNYNKCVNEIVIEALTKNEHDRWNAYTRSIGYSLAKVEDVEKYIKNTGDYRHFLARMHPALAEYEDLDEVSKQLNKILTNKIDLRENDRRIVMNMPTILEKYITE